MRTLGLWAVVLVAAGSAVACGGGGGGDPGPADIPAEAAGDPAPENPDPADPGAVDDAAPGEPVGPEVPGDASEDSAMDALADALPDVVGEDVPPVDPGPDDGPDPDVGGPDDPVPDLSLADPGPDADPGDAPAADPAPGDSAGDADPEVDACVEAVCPVPCPFGSRPDPDGCPTCDCRECNAPDDCAAQSGCLYPWCSPAGECTCDCSSASAPLYACPDGTQVDECACGPLGWACSPHPEYRCPTLCRPGEVVPMPCPDGSFAQGCSCAPADCVPQCRAAGTYAEGWYDGCSAAALRMGRCAGCRATCRMPGTPEEGWYESCGGELLKSGPCAPRFACDPAGTAGCVDPRCTAVEGMEWACPDGSKVAWCGCGDESLWACDATPWEECATAAPCVTVGESFATDGGTAGCCPGGVAVPEAAWDGVRCGAPSGQSACTACGDGACETPESPCTCPRDCAGATGAPGDPCRTAADCGGDWLCVKPTGGAIGACGLPCQPPMAGQPSPCPEGTGCVAFLGLQSPGFCLRNCDPDNACPAGLTCGTSIDVPTSILAGCFAWPPCNPKADLGCGFAAQCRLVPGGSACGDPGTLGTADPCDSSNDLCAGGLACWSLPEPTPMSLCAPVCTIDDDCTGDMGWDFCDRSGPGDPWGRCGFAVQPRVALRR